MAVYKCIRCGKENIYKPRNHMCKCVGCNATFAMPVLDHEHVEGMYSTANDQFRRGEFDKAAGIYELILHENPNDAVAHWMLLLCTYGVNYCQSKESNEWKPTIKRFQLTRVMDDTHCKEAIRLSSHNLFAKEANELEKIRENIEAIQKNEEPVDVFISYKETDDKTQEKTHDSNYARMLYNRLRKEGYKVFYAPVSLKNKSGELFEPYIYAALHSAKTMVVIGTREEYFNAPWIRNEWGRYLSLSKETRVKRILIPVYRGMNTNFLPEELRAFQAVSMDLETDWESMVINRVGENADLEKLLRNNGVVDRVFLFLEKGKFKAADQKCEEALDSQPRNAMLYVGKLMAELKVKTLKGLADCETPFNDRENYQDAMRFGNTAVQEMLKGFVDRINERNEYNRQKAIYDEAMDLMNMATDEQGYLKAADRFGSILGFEDAEEKKKECQEKAEESRKDRIYDSAIAKMKENTISGYQEAIQIFKGVIDWRDTNDQITTCKQEIERVKEETYQTVLVKIKTAKTKQEYINASKLLSEIEGYKETNRLQEYCKAATLSNTEGEKNIQMNALFLQVVDEMEELKKEKVFPQVHWTIQFGRYIQDGNDPTPINWRVLAMEGNKLLLISEYALDCKPYNTEYTAITWEECTLRKWLNTEFLENAFTETERSKIQLTEVKNEDNSAYGTRGGNATRDQVFLLSIEETEKYFVSDEERECKATEYARGKMEESAREYEKRGVFDRTLMESYIEAIKTSTLWWLRSPGDSGGLAAVVLGGGDVGAGGCGVDNDGVGVRPALWLILNP